VIGLELQGTEDRGMTGEAIWMISIDVTANSRVVAPLRGWLPGLLELVPRHHSALAS